ncbi:MAG: GNAT family N-acetyltransferase [Ruminococcaceae bacterium]|nr:GNAT family N-acetyltransferase [Oscillospiraceae bacterium]
MSMFVLEQVRNENLLYYSGYEEAFDTDLKQYQSRIYPTKDAQCFRWYHIKTDDKYIGAIWLEKTSTDDFAVLGIFIADKDYRNKGIGARVIEEIIKNDLPHMHTNKILLRVRTENERAIKCYNKVGFIETQRYEKDGLNVIEMIYEA